MEDVRKRPDTAYYIIAYESGELSENKAIQFFQHLIDTGKCWCLQGHYERTGLRLIEEGLCEPTTLPF